MRIFRYELDITDRQVLELPLSSQPLSVGLSRTQPDDFIDLWVLQPEEAPDVPYTFWVVGTGEAFPEEFPDGILQGYGRAPKFLGTVVTPRLKFVWHVFC